MTDLPEPLVGADIDLRDFPFTPIFRSRLFGSEFHANASDAEWRAGVTLWLKSWDQVPAGTLPIDDISLCRLAELGRDLKQWRKLRLRALHGWRECSDGRLHHAVVAQGVLEAWAKRRSATKKGMAGASARWGSANGTSNATANSSGNATAIAEAMPGDGKGQGREVEETGKKKESSLRSESVGSEASRPKEKPPRHSPKPIDSKAFREFYDAFPLKKSRGAALKAWHAALRKATETELIEGAKRYAKAREGEEAKYTKHPATWLNNECWADDLPATTSPLATPENDTNSRRLPPREPGETDEHYQVRCFKAKGFWLSIWGAPPDSPDCCMPRSVLEKFGYLERVRPAVAAEAAVH